MHKGHCQHSNQVEDNYTPDLLFLDAVQGTVKARGEVPPKMSPFICYNSVIITKQLRDGDVNRWTNNISWH